MRNALNTANQEIISSDNQDISIGVHGIKGRRKLENGNFDNHQLMITNNLICMTDDNWQTSKVAIGQTSNGNYGVATDILSGKILAGNELIITNESGSFTLNASGATLKNASLTLETGNSRIIQNATQGFRIQKKVNNVWKDQLYADSDGNLNIVGKMTVAKDSHIGGLIIDENSIKSSNGNISLNSDGTAKIGALVIDRNSAKFDGTIRADRLEGTIINSQIKDNTISGGKMEYETVTRREIGNGAIGSTEIIRTGSAGLDNVYATHAYIENLYVAKEGVFAGACRWVYNDNGVLRTSTIQQEQGRLTVQADSVLNIKCAGKGGVIVDGILAVTNNTVVFGDFMVAENRRKNCIQKTENYGRRLINAYETAEYYYGDIGADKIENGKCKVMIEPIFSECVNLNVEYQVFLTPYGKGNIYVSKKTPKYFIVKGDDIQFCYEIKAKHRGFENERLEEYTGENK